jgi:hypothetical protein
VIKWGGGKEISWRPSHNSGGSHYGGEQAEFSDCHKIACPLSKKIEYE